MDKRYFHQRDKKSMRSEASGNGVGRGLLWEIAYHEERRNTVDQWRAVSQWLCERYVNVRHKGRIGMKGIRENSLSLSFTLTLTLSFARSLGGFFHRGGWQIMKIITCQCYDRRGGGAKVFPHVHYLYRCRGVATFTVTAAIDNTRSLLPLFLCILFFARKNSMDFSTLCSRQTFDCKIIPSSATIFLLPPIWIFAIWIFLSSLNFFIILDFQNI